jgi:hypothetical protein
MLWPGSLFIVWPEYLIQAILRLYYLIKLLVVSKTESISMQKSHPDKHWDDTITPKPFAVPGDILNHLKECGYSVILCP